MECFYKAILSVNIKNFIKLFCQFKNMHYVCCMKKPIKYFWQVGRFNLEGKHLVPSKLLDNGSYEVLFPHHYFQYDLSMCFDKIIEIRNQNGYMFEISFSENGGLISALDENNFTDYEDISSFKKGWKNTVWYNVVYATPKGRDPFSFTDKQKREKYLEEKQCRYCGVKTIPPGGLVNKKSLPEFNRIFNNNFEIEEMKNYLNEEIKQRKSRKAEFDHIIEVFFGGNRNPSNMSLLCSECHKSKSGALQLITRSPEQYGFLITNDFKKNPPKITDNMMLIKVGKNQSHEIFEPKINQCLI